MNVSNQAQHRISVTETNEHAIAPNLHANTQNEGTGVSAHMRGANFPASLPASPINQLAVATTQPNSSLTATQGQDIAPTQQYHLDDEGISAPPMKKRFVEVGRFGQAAGIEYREPTVAHEEQVNDEGGGNDTNASSPEETTEAARNTSKKNAESTAHGSEANVNALGQLKNEEQPFAVVKEGQIKPWIEKSPPSAAPSKSDSIDDIFSDTESVVEPTFTMEAIEGGGASKLDTYLFGQLSKESADESDTDESTGNDSLETASKESDGIDMPADKEPVHDVPFGTSQPDANDAGACGKPSKETEEIEVSDEGMTMPRIKKVSPDSAYEESDGEATSAEAEAVVEMPSSGEESKDEVTPQAETNDAAWGKASKETQQFEAADEGMAEPNVVKSPPVAALKEDDGYVVDAEEVVSKGKQATNKGMAEPCIGGNTPAAAPKEGDGRVMPADAEPSVEMPFAAKESKVEDITQPETNAVAGGQTTKETEKIETANEGVTELHVRNYSLAAATWESDNKVVVSLVDMPFAVKESKVECMPLPESNVIAGGQGSKETDQIKVAEEVMAKPRIKIHCPAATSKGDDGKSMPANTEHLVEIHSPMEESKGEDTSQPGTPAGWGKKFRKMEQIESDEDSTELSVEIDSPAATSKGDDSRSVPANAEYLVEIPSPMEESEGEDTSQPGATAGWGKVFKKMEQIESDDDAERDSQSATSEEDEDKHMAANVKPLAKMPFAMEESEVDGLPQPDRGKVFKTEQIESADENMIEPSAERDSPTASSKECDGRSMPAEIECLVDMSSGGAESKVEGTPQLKASSLASKEDDEKAMKTYSSSTDDLPFVGEEPIRGVSLPENVGGVTVRPKENAGEGESEPSTENPSVAAIEGGGGIPPPTELPSTGVVSLRGKMTRSSGVHKITGVWALALDTIENNKDLCLDFEYKHQSPGTVNNFPLSGKYAGWFHLNCADGQSKTKSPEKDVDLTFIKNSEGYHNVEGSGSNIYGSYSIIGTLTADEVITMCRKFEAKPKPKPRRTKKIASRKRKTTASGKKSGRPKGVTQKRGTRKVVVPCHPDSGKRYGIGKPGLRCDCCFFEEDRDTAWTPFIKCIYCGLVAHSACYPPTSTVDANGKFLCDVCTVLFHPSVNKEERTKKSEDENIPPPETLATDIEARSDGRVHGKGVYCQLCVRSDVLGGMKPTDSNSWVHLACLMSTEDAFFQNKTVVHVQSALKKNTTELIECERETGIKPKCEECRGSSGLLLKCKHEGCQLYMHALCAEILDRLRVVENNGVADIISYKCTMHSYDDIDACGFCKLSNKQNEMLECDKCRQGYHMACMIPPLTEIPEGDWFCEKCITREHTTSHGSLTYTGGAKLRRLYH